MASDDSDDEEALLQQALQMSQESSDTLSALSIKELRDRCQARGISMRGATEKSDLVQALLGVSESTSQPSTATSNNEPVARPSSSDDESPGVQTLARFDVRFACYAAADTSMGESLEHAGKVCLPRSCLAALSFLGSLPDTILLRITCQERAVFVSVFDFIDDDAALRLAAGSSPPRWGPGGVGVAAVFVPRWVRSQLAASDATDVAIALVTLPKASAIVLQPHIDRFAQRLGACADPKECLTELMNRYVAIAAGDVIHLRVSGGEEEAADDGSDRFALDVLSLRGLPGTRCGLPEGARQTLDVGAALRGLSQGAAFDPSHGVAVRAACLVDADVVCEFAPSLETVQREEAEREAAADARAAAEAAAKEAAEAEAAAVEERERRREEARAMLASLGPSESSRGGGIVSCAVRCPDGTRLGPRSFKRSDPLLAAFAWVESEWREPEGAARLPADFDLATRHPRRCLHRSEAEALTFEAAGFEAQEALFVEIRSRASD